ncbi:MAG: DUF362 domain-containing protein [Spirochaetia bacterium]|nr:DUF362 domain-containing protein [Spirochaetia bacterium]
MKHGANVAITRCNTYSDEDVYQALTEVVTHGSMPEVSGKTILLKPNILSDALPEKAITTRPEVMKNLIILLYEMGAKHIYVGDSPGISGQHFTPKHSGIYAVCKETGATWVQFSKHTQSKRIPFTYGKKLPLPTILNEVDYVFSVAKMKTHQLMYITGCVKNLFGLVPGLHKSHSHMLYPTRESFSRMIAGLYQIATPDFSILDAVVSMEGPGPAGGSPRHTGLLFGSADATAIDASMAIVMDYKIEEIPLLKELLKRSLTHWNKVEDITYPLLDSKDLVLSDYKKVSVDKKTRLFSSLLGPLFTKHIKFKHQQREPKPLFDDNLCISCGKCITICPGKALSFNENKKINANYSKCIRCYCCHEVCPADAISIEKREG